MRNIVAKTKNGATPSHAARSGAGTWRDGVGAALMAVRLSCGLQTSSVRQVLACERAFVRTSVFRGAMGRAQAPPYFATVAPTIASHCLAMTSLAAFCSSSVGNFALA